tara:strand:- start:955 stop:1122 length:168 start_codon:yes stop_codon:yes gene_type:complete
MNKEGAKIMNQSKTGLIRNSAGCIDPQNLKPKLIRNAKPQRISIKEILRDKKEHK